MKNNKYTVVRKHPWGNREIPLVRNRNALVFKSKSEAEKWLTDNSPTSKIVGTRFFTKKLSNFELRRLRNPKKYQ